MTAATTPQLTPSAPSFKHPQPPWVSLSPWSRSISYRKHTLSLRPTFTCQYVHHALVFGAVFESFSRRTSGCYQHGVPYHSSETKQRIKKNKRQCTTFTSHRVLNLATARDLHLSALSATRSESKYATGATQPADRPLFTEGGGDRNASRVRPLPLVVPLALWPLGIPFFAVHLVRLHSYNLHFSPLLVTNEELGDTADVTCEDHVRVVCTAVRIKCAQKEDHCIAALHYHW